MACIIKHLLNFGFTQKKIILLAFFLSFLLHCLLICGSFKDIYRYNILCYIFQESVDIDDMDEEEGKRLNKALSEAFRMLKGSKTNKRSKKQLNDDRILMHFRIRAIDLLEIYLKSEHVGTEASLSTYIDIMLVLFSLLEFCIRDLHQKPLENRVRYGILKCHTSHNKNQICMSSNVSIIYFHLLTVYIFNDII